MLSAHYRAPLNINEAVIETSKTEVQKAETLLKQIEIKSQLNKLSLKGSLESDGYKAFLEAMEDDLNTPNAIKAIFDAIKELNAANRQRQWPDNFGNLYVSLRKMLEIMGIEIPAIELNQEQRDLFKAWNDAKAAKDFSLADQYRQKLTDANLLV